MYAYYITYLFLNNPTLIVIITQHWGDITERIDEWHLLWAELNSINDLGTFPATIDNVFPFRSSRVIVLLDQPTGMNWFEPS